MTTILSVPGTARLAERIVRQSGGDVAHDDLIGRLDELDVDQQRATAGVGLAVVLGRLQAVESDDGPCLRARPTSNPTTPGAAA